MNNEPVLWIDPLHDLSVRYAAQCWGKDLPETWGIISRAIKSEDLSNPVPVPEFLLYVSPPPIIPARPLQGAWQLGDVPKTEGGKRKFFTVFNIIFFCCMFLLAYGWIKDTILFPLMYASAPIPTATNTPFLLRPNPTQPQKTSTPNTSIRQAFPECLHWSEVTAAMQGDQVCVFGIVTSFYPTAETSTRINFTDKQNSFFIYDISFIYPNLEPGWCVLVNGKVELQKDIPFIEVLEGMSGGFPPKPSDCQ